MSSSAIEVTLRFIDPSVTKQFINLCHSHGYHGTVKKEDQWDVVKVTLPDKQTKRKLISQWADITCERK